MLMIIPLLAPPSGAEILQRSQRAYDAVQTFEQEITGAIGSQKGTAHVWFARPNRLRVSGQSMFGSKYDLVSDGKQTWVFNGGSWSQSQSAEIGIATITGISANAGTLVPAALIHAKWGSLDSRAKGKLLVTTEKERGKTLLRVQGTSPYPSSTWVDASSYFVTKTEMTFMNRKITVVFGPPKLNQPIPASRFSK